jgi:hypothetical protein
MLASIPKKASNYDGLDILIYKHLPMRYGCQSIEFMKGGHHIFVIVGLAQNSIAQFFIGEY